MKTRTTALILTLLISGGSLALAEPMSTAFTYQGQLSEGTNAAIGSYDLRFTVYGALSGGAVVAGPVTNHAVGVAKGLFSTTLDFGSGVFNGEARWLEVAVRSNGAAADFVAFEPRQPLTASPYALHAGNAGALGGQPPANYAPASGSSAYVAKSGDTMTGPLSSTYFNFNGNPPLPTTTTGTIFEQANVGPTVSGLGFDIRTGNPPFWDFGSRLRIDASGNVGIGTTTPKSKLEVNGTIGFVPSDFLANDAIDGFWTVKADSTDSSKLIFFEKGGEGPGVTTPRLTLAHSGNVGIGTTSPQAKLHVFGSGSEASGLGNARANAALWLQPYSQSTWGLALGSATGQAQYLQAMDMEQTNSRWISLNPYGGNVGIGTANPASTLHLSSGGATQLELTSTYPGAGDWSWGTGWGGGVGSFRSLYLYDQVASATRMVVDWAGNVGIGTTAPAVKLDVAGTVRATTFQGSGESLTEISANNITAGVLSDARLSANVALLNSSPVSFSGQVNVSTLRAGNTSLATTAVQGTAGDSTGVYGASTSGTGVRGYSSSGSGVVGQSVSSYGVYANSGTGYGLAASGGNVGVYAHNTSGTPGRDVYLATAGLAGDFYGDIMIRDNDLFLRSDANHGIAWRASVNGGAIDVDGPFVYGWGGGCLGVAGPDAAALTWDWMGNVWVSNNVSVKTLTIRGGADLAEPFPVTDLAVEPGAVMVIDEKNPGQLKQSSQPYDRRVAGIVSGAKGVQPGIQMQQEELLGKGQNIALTGRVYVKADSSNGAIQPGDLLTTSAIPGHAMKVTDHVQAQGAILGKAMSGLRQGSGMVLVLVSLQ